MPSGERTVTGGDFYLKKDLRAILKGVSASVCVCVLFVHARKGSVKPRRENHRMSYVICDGWVGGWAGEPPPGW